MEERDQIEQMKALLGDYLRQKGIRTTKPFCCLNPMHEDKHPSMSFYTKKQTVHCFSCGVTYDIFDLIGLDYHLSTFPEKYRKALSLFGNGQYEPPQAGKGGRSRSIPLTDRMDELQTLMQGATGRFDYLKSRGISEETCRRYGLFEDEHRAYLPIFEGGRCTGWCARAISDRITPRYQNSTGAIGCWKSEQAGNARLKVGQSAADMIEPPPTSREILSISQQNLTGRLRAMPAENSPELLQASKVSGLSGFTPTTGEQAGCNGEEAQSHCDDLPQASFLQGQGRSYLPCEVWGGTPMGKDSIKDCCFVTEGILNALILVQMGHRSVALCGSQNTGKLLKYCAQNPSEVNGCTFILCGDDDDAGRAMNAALKDGLRKQGLCCRELHLTGGDINEVYLKEPQRLADAVSATLVPDDNDSPQASAGGSLDAFFAASGNRADAMPTGFDALDDILDGGLYSGLYVIGAISSAGKTSFVLQLADYIAAHSADVLFFSLEQSKFELIAKSLSRTSAQLDNRARKNAFTARQLLVGNAGGDAPAGKFGQALYREPCTVDARNIVANKNGNAGGDAPAGKFGQALYKVPCAVDARNIGEGAQCIIPGALESQSFGESARQVLMEKTRRKYAQDGAGLFIYEGIADIGVTEIREAVRAHVARRGTRPVVMIDYLQILKPVDLRATDKQNTDRAVVELKRISRDFDIPVIAVSSFNRDNYRNAVSMEAFKESGAVEYSSDVLFGIQFAGAGEAGFDVNAAKTKEPRAVELVMLKNRNGIPYAKVKFDYYARFNLFEAAAQRKAGH